MHVVVIGYEDAQIVDIIGDALVTCLKYVHYHDRTWLSHTVLQIDPHVDDQFLVVNVDSMFDGSLAPVIKGVQGMQIDGALAVVE